MWLYNMTTGDISFAIVVNLSPIFLKKKKNDMLFTNTEKNRYESELFN